MDFRIRGFQRDDADIIHPLFPEDWHFDFHVFVRDHFSKPWFQGITFLCGNRITGFGNLIQFGKSAWLGNIVVDKEFRGRGLGTRITRDLVEKAENRGARSLLLIATELGIPVYRKIGFGIDQYYGFFRKDPPPSPPRELPRRVPVRPAHHEEILRMDRRLTGEDRREFLPSLFTGAQVALTGKRTIEGYYLPSFGNGLVMAVTPEAGRILLDQKIRNRGETVVIPLKNLHARGLLEERGYRMVMKAPRMFRGEEVPWDPGAVYSRATGYCG